MKIHHNTLKKAKTHGISLSVCADNEVTAEKDGVILASHPSGSVALDMALAKLEGDGRSIKAAVEKLVPLSSGKAARKPRKVVDEDEEAEDDEGGDEIEAEYDGEDDVDVDEEAEEEGKTIVKRKYKERYKPFKMCNGDDVAQQVAAHIKIEDDAGQSRIDPVKLKKFAELNGCWVKSYSGLNMGLRRMNIVNRLRAKIRHGHTVLWG